MKIAILEDNEERIQAMQCHLTDKFPFYESRFFRTADTAITWLRDHLDGIICLSLDHDLESPPGAPDPGTGRDVVNFLADTQPKFPVVIHSTNLHAAIAMDVLLGEHGWSVSRISPYGDLEWISEVWLPTVRTAILAQADRPVTPAVIFNRSVTTVLSTETPAINRG